MTGGAQKKESPMRNAGSSRAIDAAEDRGCVFVAPGEYIITEPIDVKRLHDPETPKVHGSRTSR